MAVNTNFGDRENQIASMQTELNNRYGTKLTVDGSYNPQMKQALSDLFKRNLGMTYTFKRDDRSNLVYLLQMALHLGGYNLNLNGMYDPATAAAVRRFQRNHRLAENGIADPDLLRLLFPDPAPMPTPRPMPRPMPMPLPAPMPAPKPTPLPAPMPTTRPAPPVPPVTVNPLPAPAPNRPMPPKPVEYNIRLSARNPEAVIKVKYDR